ncbi:MAG: hypothetical protein WHS87_03135 [Anaerolineales bacterium]
MNVRRLEWLDIPEVLRFRNDVLGLDTTRLLTRGNPLSASTLFSHLQPLRRMCSMISTGERPLIGGIHCSGNKEVAHLLYLAPNAHLHTPALSPLIEALLGAALEWGVLYVLAEMDESLPLLDTLRHLRFSTYLWQSIWDLSGMVGEENLPWESLHESYAASFFSLYHQIVPPLLHVVEHPGRRHQAIYRAGEMAYALLNKGMQGVLVTPLFHPDLGDPRRFLRGLVAFLRRRYNRPIYLRLPTYQSWLEDILLQDGARRLEQQVLLVHHLARLERVEATASVAALHSHRTTPIIPTSLSGRFPRR